METRNNYKVAMLGKDISQFSNKPWNLTTINENRKKNDITTLYSYLIILPDYHLISARESLFSFTHFNYNILYHELSNKLFA